MFVSACAVCGKVCNKGRRPAISQTASMILLILRSKYKPDKIPRRRACEHSVQRVCAWSVCVCLEVRECLVSSRPDAYEK